MTNSEKNTKKEIRKLAKGNHNISTIKRQLNIETGEFDAFIKAELDKKIAKVLAQPFYAGRNIRY